MNRNGGAPGMKRRMSHDPRQRPHNQQNPHPGRFNQPVGSPIQGRGRFPGGRGSGPPPAVPGRGGRGGPPRGMHQGRGPPVGAGRGMNGRGPVPGRGPPMRGRGPPSFQGGRSQHLMGGRGAPPPPPPPPRGAAYPNNGNVQVLPPPPGASHYGPASAAPQGRGIPPPPPSRPPQYQQQQQQRYHQQPQQRPFAPSHQQPQTMQFQPQNQFQQRPPPPLNPNGGAMPHHGQYQQQQRHLYPPQQQQLAPFHTNQYGAVQTQPAPVAQSQSHVQATAYAAPQQRHTAAVVSTASPNSASTPYTKEQIEQAWTEHAHKDRNGVKYYHNSLLQTSTFTKPECMVRKEQVTNSSAAGQAATVVRPWTEYTDASTGKKYYSNGVTTTWEKPEGFVSPIEVVAQSTREEPTSSSQSERSKKKRKKAETETPFRNHEEAVAAFKGLLLAKDVSPTQKWNEVVKMCSSDARWDACEAVLSTGERKQAMAEYQTKRANELRIQERQERARAKDAFSQLLTEVLPKQSSFSVWNSRFVDIREFISKDSRFYAVPDEGQRESLFIDFCEELRKHDERKKRNKKREAQEAFLSFLKEKEEAGVLSFSSTWNNFLSSLNESDHANNRFEASPFMNDSDRQLYFADFVLELQAAEDDKRRRIRDAQRRAEKAQRDAFTDALERLAFEGKITPSSPWQEVEKLIQCDSSFGPVHEQGRDAPREVFEEYIEEWQDVYRRDRSFLTHLVHPSSNREIVVTADMKYDEFVKALLEEANSPQLLAEVKRITKADDATSSARVYFSELVDRAKDRTAVLNRRRNLARRGALKDESSEDEGEIIEDEETEKETENCQAQALNS